MAAPVVTVGLTTYAFAESGETWVTIGGGAASFETDYYIQGTQSYTKRASNGTYEIYTANGGSVTLSNGEHVYVWLYATGRAIVESVANGGFGVFMSDGGSTNYKEYFTGGSDVSLATGWRCFVADPNQTPTATNGTPPTNTLGGLGGRLTTNTAASGRNFACDVIRVGTGLTISRGELNNASGFSTVTAVNDTTANQYGVFAASETGAVLQGDLTIGIDDASTDTYFSESNSTILVPDKNPLAPTNVNTASDFSGITIVGSATTCILSNISFFTADSHDKGYFDCGSATNAPLNVELDGCTFQNWGPTTLSGFTTATNTTWIGCEPITLNSGTIDNCTVEAGIGGTYVFAGSTPNNISNTSFIGVNTTDTSATGYGHAIEITSSGTYNFVNNSFVGFDTTGSDGAALNINGSGIDVTLNISGNDATASPTYKLSNGANTPIINAAVTVNVTGLPVVGPTEDATEIRVLLAGQDLFTTATGIGTTSAEDAAATGIGTESHRSSTYSFTIKKDIDIDLRIINLDYIPQFISSIRTANDPTNIASNMKLDRVSQNEKQ